MPAGRPTDLTPEVIEDVRRILPTVMYLESVADYLGLSRDVIRLWQRRGRKEYKRLSKNPKAKPRQKEAIYLEFITVYKKALAEGEIHDAGVIKKASQTNWQAAAWRLERRFPHRWGSQKDDIRQMKKDIEAIQKNDQSSKTSNPAIQGATAPEA
jgi:transposase